MDRKEFLKYGNELTICGFVVGNANEQEIIYLPGDGPLMITGDEPTFYTPNNEEIHQIIRQLDVQDIEGLQKVILRKSQRQIDQRVQWEVFRRDEFRCVYCGADDVPMTIDHIVLWEHMGDTVPDNLNCSCKKCNKTRGSMDYDDWLRNDYLKKAVHNAIMGYRFDGHNDTSYMHELERRGLKARKVPLRKTKRSR